ncbi:hypothetical protein RRG08_043464 [Elysia crispata]|uniref:Uncharacterized protein n=1 Tax=Elysia crispata TaxID=231223 RepID=A0AAE0Y2U8_9GAST|nr:hypothetical protein RRG08_043464 [Elysia crispata]
MSVQDFKDKFLSRVHNDEYRDQLRLEIDLTVRLRLYWTSLDRPDDDELSYHRGTMTPRMGTGYISHVSKPVSDKPCPCGKCNGEITRKFWRFSVRTAAHVVYNTEEAKSTRVDLFYDDDSCRFDGRMVTVTPLRVVKIYHDEDLCYMECVTHDEALGERIKSLWTSLYSVIRKRVDLDLSSLDCLPPCDRDRCPTLIVSHPHGQPKKITLGQGRDHQLPLVVYNAATCPGSSGAPVFLFYRDTRNRLFVLLSPPVHSGSSSSTSTQHQDQLNIITRFLQNLRGRKSKQEQHNYGYWAWLLC